MVAKEGGQLFTESREFAPEPLLLLCPGAFGHTRPMKKAEEKRVDMPHVGVRDHLIDQAEQSKEFANSNAIRSTRDPVGAEQAPEEDLAKDLDLLNDLSCGEPPKPPMLPYRVAT
jgi:hypothetical protein